MGGRTYTDLKKEYGIATEKFERLAKKVTQTYVNSLPEYSQEQLAKDFDLTSGAVRKLMDYAIIHALVTRKSSTQVLHKSVENQQRKHPEAGGSSLRHHKMLMHQRNIYIAYYYDEDKIRSIVQSAIQNPERRFEETIRNFEIETRGTLFMIFERAIENLIISQFESKEIIRIILNFYPSEDARDYWKEVYYLRESNEALGKKISLEQALRF